MVLGRAAVHTAVTGWIDTLCSPRYLEDDLEGITELVESINLQQATGVAEASRALRKKLKYSNLAGQLRALTILQALVENCGPHFTSTFANDALVDRIKVMAGDPSLDAKLRRKLMAVLAGWHRQFRDDPKMQLVSGLYSACGGGKKTLGKSIASDAFATQTLRYEREAAARAERKSLERNTKDAEKEKVALAKRKAKKSSANAVKRPQFDFETEKPKIMTSVGMAAQSSENLLNALMHVDREKESPASNARVVECLAKLHSDRKCIVRYIQRVEHDPSGEYIGLLLATNERVLAALERYDRMTKPAELDSEDELEEEPQEEERERELSSRLSAFEIRESEVDRLQVQQKRRLQRITLANSAIHPDLIDLAFAAPPSASSSTSAQGTLMDDPIPRSSLSLNTSFSNSSSSSISSLYSSENDDVSHFAPLPSSSRSTMEEEGMTDPFADPA